MLQIRQGMVKHHNNNHSPSVPYLLAKPLEFADGNDHVTLRSRCSLIGGAEGVMQVENGQSGEWLNVL